MRCLRILALTTALFAPSFVGCQQHSPPGTMTRSEVYFGLSRPSGPDISSAEFEKFVETQIAPRFPRGFTIVPAQGHWREATGKVVAEDSRLLILFSDAPPDAKAVDEICRAYREQFGQEAVLKVTSPAHVEFETASPSDR